jgi:hypothetical protein
LGRTLGFPPLHDDSSVGDLDLLGAALTEEGYERVVSFIGGAAHGVPHDDHPIAEIQCTKKWLQVRRRLFPSQ